LYIQHILHKEQPMGRGALGGFRVLPPQVTGSEAGAFCAS